MNRNIGHWYRAGFAALCWVLLLVCYVAAPAARIVLIWMGLLTVSFSIFTLVLWLADRRRAK